MAGVKTTINVVGNALLYPFAISSPATAPDCPPREEQDDPASNRPASGSGMPTGLLARRTSGLAAGGHGLLGSRGNLRMMIGLVAKGPDGLVPNTQRLLGRRGDLRVLAYLLPDRTSRLLSGVAGPASGCRDVRREPTCRVCGLPLEVDGIRVFSTRSTDGSGVCPSVGGSGWKHVRTIRSRGFGLFDH